MNYLHTIFFLPFGALCAKYVAQYLHNYSET